MLAAAGEQQLRASAIRQQSAESRPGFRADCGHARTDALWNTPPKAFQSDREIVLAAVREEGSALQYAAKALQSYWEYSC